MALKAINPNSSSSHFPHLSVVHSPPYVVCNRYALIRPTSPAISLRKSCYFLFPIPLEILSTGRTKSKRYAKSTEESTEETSAGNGDDDDDDSGEESYGRSDELDKVTTGGSSRRNVSSLSDALNLGSRDPVYEVFGLVTYGVLIHHYG